MWPGPWVGRDGRVRGRGGAGCVWSRQGALEQGSGRKRAVQLTDQQEAWHGHSLREQVCGEETGIQIWTQPK